MAQKNNRRISIHHIGGRAGSRGFPVLTRFENDMVNVMYDADSECLDQVKDVNKKHGSELHVLPYCLGAECKPANFNINYDLYTSSLLDSNPDYGSCYFFRNGHDYIWSEATKTIEKRNIEMVTMDSLFQSNKVDAPPPDFLSIDTQGSEYDILTGAKETLKSSTLALVLEAEFHPVYKNQKLFGDLVNLLSELGFNFVKFLTFQEMSAYRAPIGLRGEGFQSTTDVLFLKRIESVQSSDTEHKSLMLKKLAFISFVFNQFEYGLEALRQSQGASSANGDFKYLKLLEDVQEYLKKMPEVYPGTFFNVYPTFEKSRARFEAVNHKPTSTNRVKKLLDEKVPTMYSVLRKSKSFYKFVLPEIMVNIKNIFAGNSQIEKILIEYGLNDQAGVLKKQRIFQTQCLNNR